MRGRTGLVLATLLLGATVFATGSVLVLRLFYTWGLVLLTGFIWVRLGTRRLEISASPLPERAEAGQVVYQDVTVATGSRLPMPAIDVRAVNDLPGGDASAVLELSGHRGAVWQVQYPARRRGRYHLGQYRLSVADPFGLFHREVTMGAPSELIIHPPAVPLPPFSLLGLAGGGLTGRMAEGLSASASSIREYTSGDSLRHIHWRSTAHTGKYMVKTFDADRSRHRAENYWVILDMSAPAHSGQGDESTAEYAVCLAAALAREYLSHGFSFGLIIGRGEPGVFHAAVGAGHLTGILDALSVVEPGGTFSFTELIARNLSLFSSDSTVAVITPSASSALTDTCHQLTARGCAVAYFLIDGTDFGGSSPAAAGRSLTQLGAPVYLLRRAESIRQSLEQAACSFSGSIGGMRS